MIRNRRSLLVFGDNRQPLPAEFASFLTVGGSPNWFHSFSISLRLTLRFLCAGEEIVERNAEAVQRPGHQVVLTNREDKVHHLLSVVGLREDLPGLIRDYRIFKKIVSRLYNCGFVAIPAGLWSLADLL